MTRKKQKRKLKIKLEIAKENKNNNKKIILEINNWNLHTKGKQKIQESNIAGNQREKEIKRLDSNKV